MFSGQGSQWAGMGADLLATEPVFAATVAELEPLIARGVRFLCHRGDVGAGDGRPESTGSSPRCSPSRWRWPRRMKSYGVTPGAVIGHSMGEVAAAVVAGALTLEDGVKVICRRSGLMSRIAGSGAMASVELPAQQVLSELAARGVTDVSLAVVASPQSTVIGGATQSVRDLVAAWEQRDVMAREVAVDVASHSPQVDPILDELADALADLQPDGAGGPVLLGDAVRPARPCRTATPTTGWTTCVTRCDSPPPCRRPWRTGYRVFAELSPHPLLTHAVEQTARSLDMPLAALAGDAPRAGTAARAARFRRRSAQRRCGGGLLGALSRRAAGGCAAAHLDPHVAAAGPRRPRRHARGGATVAVHPLLGSHVVLPEEPERHVWQGEVGTAAQPWLADHQVHEVAVLPGAAYCEMALAAARAVFGDAGEVRDVSLRADAAARRDDTGLRLGIGGLAGRRRIRGRDLPGGRTYAAGQRGSATPTRPPTSRRPTTSTLCSPPTRTASTGPTCGRGSPRWASATAPPSRAWPAAYTAEGRRARVLAAVALPGPLRSQQGGYGVHPALLDACFQSVVAHPDVQNAADGGMLLPLGVRRLRAYGSPRNAHYCYSQVVNADADGVEADLDVLDEHGAVLLSVTGLRLGTGASEKAQADRLLNERLLTIEWQQRELPEADDVDAGSWLLINTSETATCWPPTSATR